MKSSRRSLRRGLIATVLLPAALLVVPACRKSPPFSYDFEHEGILDELEWKCGTLLRLSPEHATSGSRSLEISFFPATRNNTDRYPGVTFAGFDPDWTRGYAFVFDVYNPENTTLQLGLRIDDRESPEYADRINRAIAIAPGGNRVAIPLTDLVTSGTKHPLDLRRVRTVILFLVNPADLYVLFLDRIRVE